MSGLRRGVKRRAAWVTLLSLLVVSITLVSAGIALADKWTDISDAQWQSQYGVTAAQAATVAGGFQDGSFHPKEAVKRGQFAKMVVDGFGVATYSPSTATFPDVAKSNTFFKYVEGGVKAGIISGYSDGTYKPNNTVTRQQANNILGAYLSDKELDQHGAITGTKGTYTSLSAWYALPEGALILAAFKDATKVAAVHAPGTAYLVFHEVVKGSNGNLTPGSTLTRAQAVALIIRVREADFGAGPVPTVTGVNPAGGPATGGNGVVITGTNFTGVTSVKFGTTSSIFTVNSATQITATAPPGTSGTTVDITITTGAGISVPGTGTKYSYGQPVITSLAPNGGSANGNTAVTITGTGFTGVTSVKFGTVAAKNFTVVSPTQITAVSPAGTNGTAVDVTVTSPAGTSAISAASKYTYGVPTITKLEPAAGPATGANTVIITGSGFVDVTGSAGVKFGQVNATSYVVNSTEKITAVAPAATAGTTVDVIVTNAIGQSGTAGMESKYSYGPPTITKLNPTGGSDTGGETVTITGTGFTGVTVVKFGTLNAKSFLVSSPTTMTAVAPAGTSGTTVDVFITNPAGTNVATGTANDYSYGVPTVSALNPAAGPTAGNNSVIITGANFVGLTLAEQVKFGTKNALSYTVNSSTQITAVAPSGTVGTTVSVSVTNAAGASSSNAGSMYSYGLPTVHDIDPAAGPLSGANQVIINGTGFTGVSAVKFGGTSVSFTVNSPTKITTSAPPGALDTVVDVTVTTPAGVSVLSDTTTDATDNTKYRYILAPTVTSISPISGRVEGGDVVTVIGTYFIKGYTTVKFGTKSATDVNVISDTELTCKSPSGTSGTIVSVIVTNPVGQSPNTAADDYAYGIPTVTSLNPAAGPIGGANAVIITGTAFSGVTTVKFGNYTLPTNEYTVNSLAQITAIAPNSALISGGLLPSVDVTVSNATGTSDVTGASKYSYGPPVVTSMSIDAATGTLTINGSSFTGTKSSMTVVFTDGIHSAAATVTDVDPVHCAFVKVTPPAQGPLENLVNVRVTTAAGTSADAGTADNYYFGAPTVTGLNPVAGPNDGGNSVVITGTGFTNATAVKFGNQLAGFTVNSATQITALAPNGADYTIVDVTVTGEGGGISSTSAATKYSFGEPRVTLLEPNGGPITGGTVVTITGSNFRGVSSVRFDSVPGTNVTIIDYEHLTVVAPSTDTAGTVDVTVVNPAGSSSIVGSANDFTYGLPVISSISPAAGSSTGGETVTIQGSGFGAAPTVRFGATSATISSSSATQIKAKAPAGVAGSTVYVEVTNGPYVSAHTSASQYSYGAPTVSLLSDNGGPAIGGNQVIIHGTGFTGVTSVRFGSTVVTPANYTVDSPTQITVASAPSGTGTVHVTVTTPAGTSDSDTTFGSGTKYSYGLPALTSMAPAAGVPGTGVVITGTNLLGVEKIYFGPFEATFVVINSATQITVMAPIGGSGTQDVVLTNGYGDSLVESVSQAYSFVRPTVTGLSPQSGPATGGTVVTITGTGFTGVTEVKFGAASVSYTVLSKTQIRATAPAGTTGTTVPVSVTNLVGESTVNEDYAYGVPTVTSVSPAAGAAGNSVTITGANFSLVSHVYFRDTASEPDFNIGAVFTVVDSTHITATVPAGYLDGMTVDVIVVTGAGESATSKDTKFSYGPPTISSLSPTSGPNGGGTSVTITGTGFTGVISVTFGGISAAKIVNSPTSITATAPGGTQFSTVQVRVTTSAGTSVDSGTDDDFYYN